MTIERALLRLIRAAPSADPSLALHLLAELPELATDRLELSEETFLPECDTQIYAGDTALHAAAFAYNAALARRLVELQADVRARNRRGAEPIHAAAIGVPGSGRWAPQRQSETIAFLIEAGADPDAPAAGGVTPLHRAVRNRCSAAVATLLAAGADPHRTNDRGSTAFTLARLTTGRSGSGSPEARAEQEAIVQLLSELA